MDKLLELLEQLKQESDAELVKVYFQNADNYSIKLIKDGSVCRRFKKGYIHQDLKEYKTKGAVNKKWK